MNGFFLKKMVFLVLVGLVSGGALAGGILLRDSLPNIIAYWLGAVVLMAAVGHFFIFNEPIIRMLEGQGYLVLSLDSAGLILPGLARPHPPWLTAIFGKSEFETTFDRELVHYITNNVPTQSREFTISKKVKVKEKVDGKDVEIEKEVTKKYLAYIMDADDYIKAKFSDGTRPVLLLNRVTETFYTKEFLATQEGQTYSHHLLIYQNRKLEELTKLFRDFQRYVSDQFKPMGGLLDSPWIRWVIIIIIIAIMAYLFWPAIQKMISGVGSVGGDALGTAGKAVGSAAGNVKT